MDIIRYGKVFSKGIAQGNSYVYAPELTDKHTLFTIDTSQVDEQLEILRRAQKRLTDVLLSMEQSVEQEIDKNLAAVFKAHQFLLNDPIINNELECTIRTELLSAGSAVKTVFNRWIALFESAGTPELLDKTDDLRDLMNRLISFIAGNEAHPLENVPNGAVVIAKNLHPSDTIHLARKSVSAIIIEQGGMTSHATLFCREISLPCIGQIADATVHIPNDETVIVDADRNELIIAPTADIYAEFLTRESEYQRILAERREAAQNSAETLDHKKILVVCNIGSRDDAERAALNGADGVGLLRLEKIYMSRTSLPSTADLIAEFRSILEPIKALPIVIRLLDLGADKTLPYVQLEQETNPALGCRGVRLLLEHPHLLETQIDTLITLSHEFDLRLLIPMVTNRDDVVRVKEVITRRAEVLSIEPQFLLGAMIETPAAALTAEQFLSLIDFISFGTNDLTQYTCAADRENDRVNSYFDDTSEAIFKLLELVQRSASGLMLAVCGELAGRSECTQRLVSIGIDVLSVPPNLVPEIKEAVRNSYANL